MASEAGFEDRSGYSKNKKIDTPVTMFGWTGSLWRKESDDNWEETICLWTGKINTPVTMFGWTGSLRRREPDDNCGEAICFWTRKINTPVTMFGWSGSLSDENVHAPVAMFDFACCLLACCLLLVAEWCFEAFLEAMKIGIFPCGRTSSQVFRSDWLRMWDLNFRKKKKI